MLVLRVLLCGVTRATAAEVVGLGRATVQRYVAAERDGGLDGLRRWDLVRPVGDLAAHAEAVRASLTASPVRTAAEAGERIAALTGVRRRPTQVRAFRAGLGFRWRRVRAVPVPPQKSLPDHVGGQKAFLDAEWKPRLDRAVTGRDHVLFVDAAHFVHGTYWSCLWSVAGCSSGPRPAGSGSTSSGRGTRSPGRS